MKPFIVIFVFILIGINVNAQWEPDRKLSTGEKDAITSLNMSQCIAVNGDVVHIVWHGFIDGSGIYYKRSTDGGVTWGDDIRLTGVPSYSDYPAIAVAGNNVHIVYGDTTDGIGIAYYKRSLDGGNTWEPPVSMGKYNLYSSIAVSGTNVFIALNRNDSGKSEVWLRRSTDNGTTWDSVIQISNGNGISNNPTIAAAGGNIHLAWNDKHTGTTQVFYRRSTNNGVSWDSEISLSEPSGNTNRDPMLFVTGTDVDIVWTISSGVMYRHSGDYGIIWGLKDSLVEGLGSSIGMFPSIIRDGSQVHLICAGFPLNGIFYQKSVDGGVNWGKDTNLVHISIPIVPFIAVTGPIVHVIWPERKDGHFAIYYKRNPTGNNDTPYSISISNLPSQFCQGENFTLQYQATGSFSVSNVFTAQLSDASGDFSNPTDIGSIHSTSSGTINVNIPSDISLWTEYRIRIISSSPSIIGTDNGSNLTIYAKPSPTIQGTLTACQNSTQTFSTFAHSGYFYKWTVNGANIVGDDNKVNVLINWTTSNTIGTVTLQEKIDATGCSDTISQNILLKPVPNVTISGPQTVLKGSTQYYSGPSSDITSYKWQVTGGNISGADDTQDVVVNWGNPGNGTIKLICTNSNECSDSLLKSISINNTNLKITGSENVCEQNTTDYSTPFISGRSYEWTSNGGTIEGISSDTIVLVKWENAGNGSINLIQTIDASQVKDTANLNITINPRPQAIITGKDSALKGNLYTYTASLTDGTYFWEAYNGTINGLATEQTVEITWEFDDLGTVNLTETNKEGCSDTTSLDVALFVSSVKDNSNPNQILLKIIPNPMNGKAKIEITANGATNANIQIVNSYGNVINEFGNIILNEGKQYIDWNGSGVNGESIPSGIYFIKLSSKYGIVVQKVAVLK